MTLQTRISMITVGLMLAILATVYYAAHVQHQQREEQHAAAIIKERQALWNLNTENLLQEMVNAGSILMRDKDTLAALRSGNTKGLAEAARYSFILLQAQKILDSLVLTDDNGNIVFSAPQPATGNAGALTMAALDDGKVRKALEKNSQGKLQIVTITPLFSRGQTIGAGIYGSSLQHALERFSQQIGGDASVFSIDGQLEYSTRKQPLAGLGDSLPPPGRSSTSTRKEADRIYSVVTLPLFDASGKPVAYLVSANDKTAMYQQIHRVDLIAIGAITAVFLLVVALLSWILGRIFKPVRTVVDINHRIAKGCLDTPIPLQQPNTEIGQLLLTADTMQKKLGHIVRDVRCGSDKITSISTKISRNNHSLATRTEEQANSLETTSSSMEEIASAARQNADNATSANKLAQTMIKQADAGDHSIIATIDAVEDISNRSQQIEDIVGMIDEIAFQTNLLALNASVEAARAGEQGKGFSVVAGEVRNLAERSAKAANEVKTLIADTRETVGRGVSLASASGEALTAIIESVHQVSNLIQEITTASSEQAAGINEINSALSQIDSTTQENSALVEETASASAELVNQAKSLQQLMGYFKLPEPSAMHSTRPPLRPSQRRGKPNRADAA